jgi:hypothetical protein
LSFVKATSHSSEAFGRVLGKLERGAAMGHDEVGRLEGAFGARLEFPLQGAVAHVVNEVVRAVADLDIELRGAAMTGVVAL